MASNEYKIFLEEAAAPDCMGKAVACSNPTALRDILTDLQTTDPSFAVLEFYLHPKDPDTLLIVNPPNCPGPLDDITFEILEEVDNEIS